MTKYTPKHLTAVGDSDETPVEYQNPVSMMFSNQTYDKLKWIAQILVPALMTLYGTVGMLWGLPETEKVVATMGALDFFLGALLAISQKTYEKSGAAYDGTATLRNVDSDEPTALSLDLDAHPDDLAGQKEITLKVNTE